MFGYATNEAEEYIPFSFLMATKLANKLTEVRKNKILPWLRPHGKTEVTVEYEKKITGEVIPIRIENILISAQYNPDIQNEEIKNKIIENVINTVIPNDKMDNNTKILINPSGKFIIGGPEGDCGLTGRKIIFDTYGSWGGHDGGAFSGKDCSKVDRNGAYMARWIAKSLVAVKLCKRCLVQLSYSIGISEPLSVYVDSYGTIIDRKSDEKLSEIVVKNFNMNLENYTGFKT